MNTQWFISDLHFFHNNIMKFTKRPFAGLDDMHEDIIQKWNSVVKRGDTVYHLGDLSFKKNGDQTDLYDILNRLNGSIVCLKGNHDYSNLWVAHRKAQNDGVLRTGVSFIDTPYMEVKHQKRKIILCHYPIACWNGQHHNTLHLHGHTHNNLHLELGKGMDVGYDALWENYGLPHPISIEDVILYLDKKDHVFYDHHGDIVKRGESE